MRLALTALAAALLSTAAAAGDVRIEAAVSPKAGVGKPLSGRLIVAISRDDSDDPIKQMSEIYTSQQLFGIDVSGAGPFVIDDSANGFPVAKPSALPPGDYRAQAVLVPYETFRRADGHVVQLPPDRGEGQQWNAKPGSPMSAPVPIHVDRAGGTIRLTLDRTVPPVAAFKDSRLLKKLHLRNDRLSRFWARDMFLDAWVLLPEGWAEHPQARYPLVLYHDHFEREFRGWRETPPGKDLKDAALDRARAAYGTYQAWIGGRLPRVILVAVNHANPYYDDSYAVNSANIGPYGDAINLDLIPEIERRFRGIGQGWARATFGGSTGGWEALATQIFYPDRWNGAWGFCPDSLDFHRYQAANLYDDANAYRREGPWGGIEVPADRASDGEITATMRSANQYEAALGSRGRSGQQFDAWQAVYSPVGSDGYPKPIYDKASGVIDRSVADYWRDHWDLTHIVERDWATLGPKLEGKLHVTVGDADTYYLNGGVHLFQEMLAKRRAPASDATFDYGAGQPHCYTGAAPDWSKAIGISVAQRLLPQMAAHMADTAPAGADVTSWRY